MYKVFTINISILTLTFLAACGGGNALLISQSDINTARQSGQLVDLYQRANKMVAESRGSSKKEAIAIKSQISALLVNDKNTTVNQLLTKQTEKPESVTRTDLLSLKSSLDEMKPWSEADYTVNVQKVAYAVATVDNQIQQAMDGSKSEDDVVSKVLLLKRAATFAGEGQPESALYKKENDKAIANFLYQGNDALERRLYSMAVTAASSGLQLDPGNVQFESMLSQGKAGLFEKDFRFALEQGKPESAYESLMKVVDDPIFFQLKKSMGSSVSLLANYFASSAQKSYQGGDLAGAYSSFRKGRTIQTKLDVAKPGFIQEKGFLELLMTKANAEEIDPGKQQSLLRVIREFDGNYPGLQSQYLKASDLVVKRAMTKLSIAEFKEVISSDSVVSSIGRRVGSKLEKLLFEKLGKEVLIVTETQSIDETGFGGLVLQIDGEVLQAAIEISRNQGKRAQRVQTGIQRTETEEYKKWTRRKRGDEPTQYTETPIEDDVELIVEHIRKQAVAEVAFRVIEPVNGSILMTDNVIKESEFKGESVNELKKGDFHQPYISADLPSDIKIMDELATTVASELGEKLSQFLQSPEKVFYNKAVEAKNKGSIPDAVELMSNALSIGEGKGKDVSLWYEELKILVLGVK